MSNATQNCEFCQSPAHIWYACPKKPDGWKPDRLKKVTSVAAPTPSPVAPDSTLGDAGHLTVGIARKPRGQYRSGQKGVSSQTTDPEAKATKAIPRDDALTASEADGVASRLSTGRTVQGAPVKAARAAIQLDEADAAHLAPKSKGGRPKVHEDRKAYRAKKAREYRLRDKAKP